MQRLPKSVSVAVIGAGPTGLAVASLLGRMGIDTLVLEKNPKPLTIPRAIVLDDEGARTLQAAGAIERLLPFTVEGEGPVFIDDDGEVLARFESGSREYGYSKRYFVHQPTLERALLQGLQGAEHVQVQFATEVVSVQNHSEHVVIEARTDNVMHSIRAGVVLACDGARSPVRQMLGIQMHGSTYADEWLVVDTENDPDSSRSTKAHCYLTRPFVSVPAPHGGRRYEFKLLPGESRDDMMSLSAVQKLLAPMRQVRAEDITRTAVYGFQARVAERLIDGRILLLGDAAHLTPPFAGQGMNAGLRDALNVAWKVALVVRGEARAELLQSYETERRAPIWAMIQLAVMIGEILMPQCDADRDLRSGILRKLSGYPGAREYLFGMGFKPRPRYSGGAFVAVERPNVPASLVGCMIPQPWLHVSEKTVPLDDLIGCNFAILVQSRALEQFALEHRAELWPELKPAIVRLGDDRPTESKSDSHCGPDSDDVAFPLRAHRDQLLLVRPDRYAALAFWPEQWRKAVSDFRHAVCSSMCGSATAPCKQSNVLVEP
jgi:3-(3-hydroxy-phenyl)propionate hydroxylase